MLEAANDAQKTEILPGLCSGERIVTLAWMENEGIFTPEGINHLAAREGDGYVLSGIKIFVPDANVADTMICAARTGKGETDISLFVVNTPINGLKINPLITMAGDKQCELVFDRVKLPRSSLLGELNRGWPLLKKTQLMASVAKCAEMMGGARMVMDLVIPWTKERIQFDRPIGSFQAVQHHCVNMLTYLDTLTFMTYEAAWLISAKKSFEKEASMCKAWVSDSHRKLVALAHQVLGGLGFMEEHALGLYFKRAKAAELFFGDADFHRELVAQEMRL